MIEFQEAGRGFVAIMGLLFFLATAAVIVSHRVNTATIVQAIGSSTVSVIGAAVSPVTGQQQK